MTDDDKPRLEIDWLRAAGGALAAVSTAVLLSTLGAAGTLIGAAVGSFALTVTSALYTQGLARSKHRLSAAQQSAQQLVGSAQSQVRRAGRNGNQRGTDGDLAEAGKRLDQAQEQLDSVTNEDADPTWGQRFLMLPWKKILIIAVGFFVAAMLLITAFEAITGRTLSSFTGGSDEKGGTSISRITGKTSKDVSPEKNRDQNDNEQSPGDDPTAPSTTAPSDEPSAQPTEPPSSVPSQQAPDEPAPEPEPAPEAPPVDPAVPPAAPPGE